MDSSLASMLMSIVLFFTIALVHIFSVDEKLNWEKLIGLVIGFRGVFVLFSPTALLGWRKEALTQIFVVCGALCYATSSIVRTHLSHLRKFQTAVAILLVGSLSITRFSILIYSPWQLTPLIIRVKVRFCIGVIQTAAAQLLKFCVIDPRGASFSSLNNYKLQLFGVQWGMLFLVEKPTSSAIIALPIILLGLFICKGGLHMPRKRMSNINKASLKFPKKSRLTQDKNRVGRS